MLGPKWELRLRPSPRWPPSVQNPQTTGKGIQRRQPGKEAAGSVRWYQIPARTPHICLVSPQTCPSGRFQSPQKDPSALTAWYRLPIPYFPTRLTLRVSKALGAAGGSFLFPTFSLSPLPTLTQEPQKPSLVNPSNSSCFCFQCLLNILRLCACVTQQFGVALYLPDAFLPSPMPHSAQEGPKGVQGLRRAGPQSTLSKGDIRQRGDQPGTA